MKRCLFFLAGCLLFLVDTNAQNIARPNIVSPSGLQVNSFTGNLFCKRTDFMIPSPGLPLDITFAYNTTARGQDNGFGFGWTCSYNQWYDIDTVGGITIYRGDGRQDYFIPAGVNFKSPTGIFDILTAYEPGKYRLLAKDGTITTFGNPSNRKVTRITDRNGNKTLFTYSGANLASVSDSLGHVISFNWSGNRLAEVVATAGSDSRKVTYEYNSVGCLVRVRQPEGVVIAYSYNTGNALENYADGNGNATVVVYYNNSAVNKLISCQLEQRISYNTEQRKTYVVEVDDGKTFATTYEFDVKGRLVNRTGNCCGYNTSFEYDGFNNITRIIDANGGTRIFNYDSRGNMLAETDQLNHTAYYTYNSNYNQVATTTDRNGNQTTYQYDARGNLISQTDAFGHALLFTYDGLGRRITETDKKGYQTTFGHDQYGYINRIVGPVGDTTLIMSDGWGNVSSKTDPKQAINTYAYDQLNRIKSSTNALQHSSHFTYDANGNLLSVKDPRAKMTRYAYNSQDKLIRTTDALNHVIASTYDGMGNMLSRTDANGHTTSYVYDNLSRMTGRTNAAGETTSWAYDGLGNKTSVKMPNGNNILFKYDAASRITEVTDEQGTLSKYSYDANANKLTATDGKGNTTTYQYDALNRVLLTADPAGSAIHFAYDYNDNLVQQTDRKGNSTNYSYDKQNRQLSVTDALNHTTVNVYDKAGNIVSITDANGNVTAYSYDPADHLIKEQFADNTTRLYAYDSTGNLKSRTDNAGQTTSFTYDDINRPILRSYAPSLIDTFAYDHAGLLITAKNGQAVISFTYDAADRVSSETLNGKKTAYSYNITAGKRIITYPGGRIIERQLDRRNQLAFIRENGGQNIATYEYDLAGSNTRRTFGNGTVTNLAFDANSRITDLNHNPARFVDLGYTYDKEDNPITTQFRHHISSNEQYGYDNTYQLTSFTKGAAIQGRYNYDGLGNRTTAELNGTPASYTVNNMNAYSGIIFGTAIAPLYDDNGNLTSNGATTYGFDRENRLITIDNGTVASYTYDPLGRRIRKATGSDTTAYYFDGLQVIEERNASDSVLTTYVWGRWVDDIVSMRRNGQPYYYHTNMLGSVVAVTNGAGSVAERYEYDAFGKATVYDAGYNIRAGGSAIGNTYLYTGREYDGESGLYYYRARYYDPTHGRFLQRDPIGYGDGMGVYVYVGNRPIVKIDPSGMFRIDWDCLKKKYGEPLARFIGGIADKKVGLGPVLGPAAGIGAGLANGKSLDEVLAQNAGIVAGSALGLKYGPAIGAGIGGGLGFIFGENPITVIVGVRAGTVVGRVAGPIVGGVIGGIVGVETIEAIQNIRVNNTSNAPNTNQPLNVVPATMGDIFSHSIR